MWRHDAGTRHGEHLDLFGLDKLAVGVLLRALVASSVSFPVLFVRLFSVLLTLSCLSFSRLLAQLY